MAEQMTLMGTWEPVVPDPPAQEPPPAVPPPPPPIDPRQSFLFEGPHSLRRAAEEACDALDGAALREAHRLAGERHPGWPGAAPWPRWAEGIEHLLGGAGAREGAARALGLDGAAAARRFPEMSAPRLERLRGTALRRAAARLLAEEGAQARLEDGRPAGWLQLLGGAPEEAAVSLQLQAQAWSGPGRGRVLGYLGEALWRCGRAQEATAAYRDAYLLEPAAVDERELTCRPVMELLDACADLDLPGGEGEWLPVVADLRGRVPLPASCAPLPAGAGAVPVGRAAASLLAAYRQGRADGRDERELMELKRKILQLALNLRELLRRV